MGIERELEEARQRNAKRLADVAREAWKPRQASSQRESGAWDRADALAVSARLPSLTKTTELNPEYRLVAGGVKNFKFYGITEADWRRMVLEQDYRCAICSSHYEYARELAIDHCHKTGKVRGLLCTRCNTGIGQLKDDPNLLRKAIEYLERSKPNPARLQEGRDTTETLESMD